MTQNIGTFVDEIDEQLDRKFAGTGLLPCTSRKDGVWQVCVIDMTSLLCRELPLDEATIKNRRLSPAVQQGIHDFLRALPELRLADAARQPSAQPSLYTRRRQALHRRVDISVIHRRPR